MSTDPIADMLTRVRNALGAHHARVEMPSSRLKAEIARILKEEGYITGFRVSEDGHRKLLRVTLKYGSDQKPVISKLARISRPGRRVYTSRAEIPTVLGGLGNTVLSTPQGVMSGKKARKAGVGGEILFEVY